MIETEIIETDKGAALGYRHLLGNEPPWLIVIQGEKGYLASDYINIEFAEKVGDACAIISNAKDFDEMLEMPVTSSTSKAREIGIKPGMSGREALDLLI